MSRKIKLLWTVIKESLWFIPALMVTGAILIAFSFIGLDSNISFDDLPFDWFLYSGNKEGARSVLSTIASSMATIAGVTFSMTLVAHTIASSQYGPRLLRNFVTNKGNQLVLGTFIATFLYALIVFLTIREPDDDEFIPKFSVVFGFLLSIFGLGVLIYFIHHIASSIAAENVIKSSFQELKTAVNQFMKDEHPDDTNLDADNLRTELINSGQSRWPITCNQSGFVEMIDFKGLYNWACARNLVLGLFFILEILILFISHLHFVTAGRSTRFRIASMV